MTKILVFVTCTLALGIVTRGQDSPKNVSVKQAIQQFVQAGDNQNASELNSVLDEGFRVIMNQLFGSTELMIMPKAVYLEKIRNKEFGGDKRSLIFHSILINGKTATADITLEGKELTIRSFLNLIQDIDGKWKLICDTPTIM